MEEADVVTAKWKKQIELMYIITYDLLFGQEVSLTGDAEKYLMRKKDALQSALPRILKRKGLRDVKDLVALDKISGLQKPRYVRVNTLKIDTRVAICELRQQHEVQEDDTVPDLLILPPGADLHNHPLVVNGSIFLQGKASSMAAVALAPKPGWEVIDACAAPGNKTVHLAALMKGKGKIIACELNKERVERLKNNVKVAGATNVKIKHEDFLNLDPTDPSYSKVHAILLDPSCSGSGTAFERLDHLLPSHNAGHSDHVDIKRLQKLAAFQKKVLEHAFSSEHLLRTDLTADKEGFFIALFVRKAIQYNEDHDRIAGNHHQISRRNAYRSGKPANVRAAKMLKLLWRPRFKLSRKKSKAPASSRGP